jgi:hypothetical protein
MPSISRFIPSLALFGLALVGCGTEVSPETVEITEQSLARSAMQEPAPETSGDSGCTSYQCDSGCIADSKTTAQASYGLQCDHDPAKTCQFSRSYTKDKSGLCHSACTCKGSKKAMSVDVEEMP